MQVVGLRRSRGEPEPVSGELLSQFWPGGDWTPAEAAEIVKKLPHAELAGAALRGRLARLLDEVPARLEDYYTWVPFTVQLARLPTGILSEEQIELARGLSLAMPLVRAAATRDKDVNEEIDQLLKIYDASRGRMLSFLNSHLPGVLLRHVIPGLGLAHCPGPLMLEFCALARSLLADDQRSSEVAARLIIATRALMHLGYEQRSHYLGDELLRPLIGVWSRAKFAAVRTEAGKISKDGHKYFDFWYSQNKPHRFQLRVPGFGPRRQED
jgi:hypothetical protein